ncbi:MAG: universal stress protein [Pseudomonadales bacterium]|nr:universal stress protein [Pseudomonadales bacterium]
MMELNKLLVLIDPEQDSQPALSKALRLARIKNSALELLICDHNSYLDDGRYFDPPQARKLRAEHLERNRELLTEMAAPIKAQGFAVSTDVLWGNPPWEKVIARVIESRPDMLIHSVRRHNLLSRLLLSHRDWELIRRCPCPLLLAREKDWPSKPVFVAAIDPLHSNEKPAELDGNLVAVGSDLAASSGGQLYLFHCYYQPPVAGIYPIEMDEEYFRQKALPLLQEFAIAEERLLLSGKDIHQSLPACMEQVSGDVVIMGVISRSRLDRFFIGSTAEKLLDHIAEDILLLKPAHFQNW